MRSSVFSQLFQAECYIRSQNGRELGNGHIYENTWVSVTCAIGLASIWLRFTGIREIWCAKLLDLREKDKRLLIMPASEKVNKIVWVKRGGRCAMCRDLLSVEGASPLLSHSIGDVAHIVAEEYNRPRGMRLPGVSSAVFNFLKLAWGGLGTIVRVGLVPDSAGHRDAFKLR
jgi:hypothetical protein